MSILIILGIAAVILVTAYIAVNNLIEICTPNEVLIFSGAAEKGRGYTVLHAGSKVRIPLFHRVDRMDVTNMVIDISVRNAYSKGGIPLDIRGVANVKIGTHSNLITNAVERFLGMSREQIIAVSKETLEGNLRGVLATLTPEEVNQDRVKFAKQLLHEATSDLSKLGLDLDTLKIQSVSDDKGYLDSLGRQKSAELLMQSRVAEAKNRAEASVLDAENQLRTAIAKLNAQKSIIEADASRRIQDAQTKAQAMVAEERSKIGSAIAKAEASINVQEARVEQVKRQLHADVIRPAQARKRELEFQARANVASTIEEGRARADALRALIQTWRDSGTSARSVFVMQQFDTIMDSMLSTIEDIQIDKITIIDSKISQLDEHASAPIKAASASEQLKQTMDVDIPGMIRGLSGLQSKK